MIQKGRPKKRFSKLEEIQRKHDEEISGLLKKNKIRINHLELLWKKEKEKLLQRNYLLKIENLKLRRKFYNISEEEGDLSSDFTGLKNRRLVKYVGGFEEITFSAL